MSTEAIAAVAAEALTAPTPAMAAPVNEFENLLSTIQSLNTQAIANQKAVADVALGNTDNLHQVLMGLEQNRLGFELLLAVRGKLLDAYQELMRLQV